YTLVQNQQQLRKSALELAKATALGVDLEADSMYHYLEKICLIQISTPSETFLIDPLSVGDLQPLAPIFADSGITKIFHGADYDIRSLYRDFQMEVNALFDTQIAAKFLGVRETGLANLLRERMGIFIEKKYQKKDWSKRPLPDAMLDYAAQDSCQLLPLARILRKELRAISRLSWVMEECEILSKVRAKANRVTPLFLSFKGASRLDPRSLAVLEEILKLRESLAKRRNVPPFKVLGNTQIMGVVEQKPLSARDLERTKTLSPKQIKAFGTALVKKTEEAMAVPEDVLPRYPRRAPNKSSRRISGRIKALKDWRQKRAAGMGVDSAIVCSNAQIQSLSAVNPRAMSELQEIRELKVWQRKAFGHEICDLMKRFG
ncbi:MAG: HRDC domain-containing protein, partial [Pseudomonadota bacterium]